MLAKVRAWLDQLLDRAQDYPQLAPLLELADVNVVLGAIGGGLVFLLVGLIGGAVNRGLAGALVGALCGALAGLGLGGLAGRMLPVKDG